MIKGYKNTYAEPVKAAEVRRFVSLVLDTVNDTKLVIEIITQGIKIVGDNSTINEILTKAVTEKLDIEESLHIACRLLRRSSR